MSFVDKIIKSGHTPIHFIRCKDAAGRDCYYFLLASYERIKHLTRNKQPVLNVGDYGKIIASGFGKEPSAEIKAMLLEKYNFDADAL